MTGEWVIIAETTADRPWSGNRVASSSMKLPERDPGCYLCPVATRAGGAINPDYKDTYVFDNDYPSFSREIPETKQSEVVEEVPAYGICRVVCFSPRHDLTLAEMDLEQFSGIINTLREQYIELSSQPGIEYVLIFENKGAVIGVSNPHPHGQIYATDFVPRIPRKEYELSSAYLATQGRCLLCDIVREELADGSRIVYRNEDFITYVPYAARYSYEVQIAPLRHIPSLAGLSAQERISLAEAYHQVVVRYDNLFEISFPNVTIFHNAPCGNDYPPEPFHFHIEFCPPMRSADKLKYMAGFETGGGNIINPTSPEKAARTLRSLSPLHYKLRAVRDG